MLSCTLVSIDDPACRGLSVSMVPSLGIGSCPLLSPQRLPLLVSGLMGALESFPLP